MPQVLQASDSSETASRRWRWAGGIVVVFFVVVGGATVDDYGMSWDEPHRFEGGQNKLEYYGHLFRGDFEQAREAIPEADAYPGLFDLSVAILSQLTGIDRVDTGHRLSFVFAAFGLLGTLLLGSHLGGQRAGTLSVSLLVLSPVFYGHAFINPKDIPFAACYIWASYLIVRWVRNAPVISWTQAGLIGMACGLAASVRLNGLYLLILFAVSASVLWGLAKDWSWRRFAQLLGRLALSVAASCATLFVFWPQLHSLDLGSLRETIRTSAAFEWPGRVLYFSETYDAINAPRSYVLAYFLITTPLLHWLAILASLVLPADWQVSRRQFLMMLACAVPPVAIALLGGVTFYDGSRHILFVTPFLAVTAGLCLDATLRGVTKRVDLAHTQSLIWLAVSLAAGLILFEMVRLHPYQYAFFNRLVGGLPGAHGKFDTEYWATSVREASLWLNSNGRSGPQDVFVSGAPSVLAAHYLDSRFRIIDNARDSDYCISITRWNAHETMPGKWIHVVARRGVPFCVVTEFRPEDGKTSEVPD